MSPRHPPASRVAGLRRLATAAFALLLIAAGSTHAGNLQVAPILLEFAHGQHSQTLWLANTGQHPLRAQIRVQQWTQAGQQDVLHSSDALLASPPLIEIAAGHSQLVRLVQAEPGINDREKAFRLIVDELPGDADTPAPGLQFLLRYSIPVFVLPPGAVPQLERSGGRLPTDAHHLQGHWTKERGNLSLALHNHGTQRIRISQLRWVTPTGPDIELSPGLLGYVLPGAGVRWTLPLPSPLHGNGTLHARLNDDTDPQALPQITAGQ